ncbi:MAG TPA: hypothetical protein VFN88_04025, partial [Caulobacteraceae bacterium]|nr:hypothetical protein [Caulobacteraceae bacterium]
ITRQAACTQTVVIDLPQTESGTSSLTAETLDVCTATGTAVARPIATYLTELQMRAVVLEEEDITQEVVPQLKRTGLAVQRTTPVQR